jgi:hypothetical protein
MVAVALGLGSIPYILLLERGTLMNNRSSFNFSLIATTIAILFGLALHSLAVYLRDNGPSFDGISVKGNGATIVLPVAVIGLIIGEIVCIRRRAWLGVIVLPFAIFIGLFVIAGSF